MNRVLGFIFALAGIAIFVTLFILALVFFSYLLLIGAVIGLILFAVAYIRSRFFHPAQQPKQSQVKGRIIEQESPSKTIPDDPSDSKPH